jgi:hypothetical protein
VVISNSARSGNNSGVITQAPGAPREASTSQAQRQQGSSLQLARLQVQWRPMQHCGGACCGTYVPQAQLYWRRRGLQEPQREPFSAWPQFTWSTQSSWQEFSQDAFVLDVVAVARVCNGSAPAAPGCPAHCRGACCSTLPMQEVDSANKTEILLFGTPQGNWKWSLTQECRLVLQGFQSECSPQCARACSWTNDKCFGFGGAMANPGSEALAGVYRAKRAANSTGSKPQPSRAADRQQCFLC